MKALSASWLGFWGVVLVPSLSGCAHRAEAVDEPAAASATPSVQVVKPVRKTLRRAIEQPGYSEAFEETPIYVKLAGYVKELRVDIGDAVRAGDLLAVLSVPELEEEEKQKGALVGQAQAEVAQAVEAVKVGEAHLGTAAAVVKEMEAGRTRAGAQFEFARSQFQRMHELTQHKILDQQQRDETLNQFKAAESTRDEVEAKVRAAQAGQAESTAKLTKLRADVQAAQARLKVAEADRQRVAALLDYTKVRAPFAGMVTRRTIHTGHFVQPPSGGSAAGTPLFVVVRADPVRIFVDVPEADAVHVRPGAAARIRIQGLHDEEFSGTVTRSAWALHRQERTLRTEIDLPNPKGTLRPGMYAHARIAVEHPGTWTLPGSALVAQDGKDCCFVLENGKARRVALRVGSREGEAVEVLKKQRPANGPGEPAWDELTGDEAVIVSNPRALTDGQSANLAHSATN
jgi:RND family efflux transporter MFP subunit